MSRVLALWCVLLMLLAGGTAQRVRIAVVGDVHEHWKNSVDLKALHRLKPDLVLFTGDFGNENVELVEQISQIKLPSAVVLGNHDCWWSGLSENRGYAYSDARVEQQIKILGDMDVAFRRKDFPDLKLSVVGARPFAMGEDHFFGKGMLDKFYGIGDLKASALKIKESILGAPEDHTVIVLGHNGPAGLGSRKGDICGADFKGGGDCGDSDLQEALKDTAGQRNVALVVFGHMHDKLAFNAGWRKMVATVNNDKTVHLNAAVVPRKRNGEKIESEFAVVDLVDGKVESIKETWMAVDAMSTKISSEKVLYRAAAARDEL